MLANGKAMTSPSTVPKKQVSSLVATLQSSFSFSSLRPKTVDLSSPACPSLQTQISLREMETKCLLDDVRVA